MAGHSLLQHEPTRQLLGVLPFLLIAGVYEEYIVGIKQLPGKARYFVGLFEAGKPESGTMVRSLVKAEAKAVAMAACGTCILEPRLGNTTAEIIEAHKMRRQP